MTKIDIPFDEEERSRRPRYSALPELEALGQAAYASPPRPTLADQLSFSEGAFKSFIYGLGPSLLHIDPSPELARFQAEHPIAALTSEVAGTLLPYSIPFLGQGALGLKLASKLPLLGRVVKTAEGLATAAPGRSVALREMARFAPLEAARVGATAALNPDKTTEALTSAILNEALIGGISGGLASIAGGAPFRGTEIRGEAKIQEKFPDWNRLAPNQLKLAKIGEYFIKHPQKELGDYYPVLKEAAEELRNEVLIQAPRPRAEAMVRRLADVDIARGSNNAKRANSIFGAEGKLSRGIHIRKLVVGKGEGNFNKQTTLDEAMAQVGGLTNDQLSHMQFPRHVETLTESGRDKFLTDLAEMGLQPISRAAEGRTGAAISNTAWIAKEADGLYVAVKRVAKRPRREKAGDRYLFFKTDNPKMFFPNQGGQLEKTMETYFATARAISKTPVEHQTPLTNYADRVMNVFTRNTDLRGVPGELRSEVVARALVRVHPRLEPAGTAIKEFSKVTSRWVADAKKFVAPGLHRYSAHPLAQRTHLFAQALFNRAGALAEQEIYGHEVFSKTGNLFSSLFRPPKRAGSIDDMIEKVWEKGPKAVEQINEAHVAQMPVGEMVEEGFDPTVVSLYKKLGPLDEKMTQYIEATDLYVEGVTPLRPLPFHYHISRTWRGSNRLPVYAEGDKGRVVGYGSGYSRNQALQEAESVKRMAEKLEPGKKFEYDTSGQSIFQVGHEDDLKHAIKINPGDPHTQAWYKARRLAVREPLRFNERTGALGFTTRLTKDEFKKALYGNVHETYRYMAQRLVQGKAFDDLSILKKEAPLLYNDLSESIMSYGGVKGPFAKKVDDAIDSRLEPVLGGNSASEIARRMNRAMFDWTLGFGDLGFVALNAASPIQTVLPEIAWVLSAPPERLAQYYATGMVIGRDGMPRSVGYVEPLRILWRAIKSMASPDEDLREAFNKAVKFRVIDKKFIEEFAGAASERALRIKDAFSGKTGFTKYLTNLIEFLPAKSEELSRGVAFTSGYHVGRDFFGLKGDALFEFASNLTNRTMYLYTTADRPRVLTGAVGTAFGLFKNWPMHYLANLGVYGGDAMRGNMAPLLWAGIGTGMVAGAAGVPLYGVADAFSRLASDKSLMQNLYDAFGYGDEPNAFVDALYYGAPSLLGVTLQGRAAAPGSAMVRDLSLLSDFVMADRLQAAYELAPAAYDAWFTTGRHPVNSQSVRDLFVRAFAPRTIIKALSFTEDNAYRSLHTGNRLISNTTLPEYLAHVFGFTPIEFDKYQDISNELWTDQNKRREVVQTYGAALAEAWNTRDARLGQDIIRRAMLQAAPISSVMRSAKARVAKQNEDLIERQFSTYPRAQLQKSLLGPGALISRQP